MATAAEEIADRLATLGLGTVGTNIFVGILPEQPDVVTAVMETGGEAPEFGFSSPGLKYEHPSIQIVCRGTRGDYDGPRQMINTAFTALPAIQGATIGSTYYHMLWPMQSPIVLNRDDDARVVMVLNLRIQREMPA